MGVETGEEDEGQETREIEEESAGKKKLELLSSPQPTGSALAEEGQPAVVTLPAPSTPAVGVAAKEQYAWSLPVFNHLCIALDSIKAEFDVRRRACFPAFSETLFARLHPLTPPCVIPPRPMCACGRVLQIPAQSAAASHTILSHRTPSGSLPPMAPSHGTLPWQSVLVRCNRLYRLLCSNWRQPKTVVATSAPEAWMRFSSNVIHSWRR